MKTWEGHNGHSNVYIIQAIPELVATSSGYPTTVYHSHSLSLLLLLSHLSQPPLPLQFSLLSQLLSSFLAPLSVSSPNSLSSLFSSANRFFPVFFLDFPFPLLPGFDAFKFSLFCADTEQNLILFEDFAFLLLNCA